MENIYDPKFVADLFDRCSISYRNWSGVASFGMVRRWRRQCAQALDLPKTGAVTGIDLMAGTGEVWPHLLRAHRQIDHIIAVDISKGMHDDAMERLHGRLKDQITFRHADALVTPLEPASADFVVSTFGMKTFDTAQHDIISRQISQVLKPGAPFVIVEATDPVGHPIRPAYRLYLDGVLPLVERFFLRGARDFAMIGQYTRNFGDGSSIETALRNAGLQVERRDLIFGCAVLLAGRKPT